MEPVTAVQPGAPGARVLRAGLVGTVVALCAVLAHATAGGTVAPFAVPVVAAAGSVVAWTLAARRLATSQLLGLLVLGQAGLHLLAAPGHAMDAAMLAGHLAATAASLVVVRHGEDAWWRLADRLVALVRVPGPVAPPAPTVAAVARGTWRPSGRTAVVPLGGRAPPVAA